MKLIDLLVKIANRYEDLPKEIEILGNNYILRHSTHMPNYFRKDKIGISISEDLALIQCLTDEVEIIEDKPKKIELLDIEFVKAFNYLLRNCVLFGEEESQKLNGHIKENSITEKGNIFEECEK